MKDNKPLIDWDELEKIDVTHERPGPVADSTAKALENAGRHIGFGLILAALIGVGGWIGYIEYKAYRAERALAIEAQRIENEAAKQQQAMERQRQAEARRNAAIAQRNREQRQTREMHARECRYWRGKYKTLKTPEIRAMVTKHCK
ncbi:MAG: DUF2681 domain-containing protein [Alloalcanivorax sp.]